MMRLKESEPAVSPVPLMELASSFWAFKALAAAHELDIFTRLSGGPGTTVAEMAKGWGIHERPAELLLTACAALGLLQKQGDRYRNSPGGGVPGARQALLLRRAGGDA